MSSLGTPLIMSVNSLAESQSFLSSSSSLRSRQYLLAMIIPQIRMQIKPSTDCTASSSVQSSFCCSLGPRPISAVGEEGQQLLAFTLVMRAYREYRRNPRRKMKVWQSRFMKYSLTPTPNLMLSISAQNPISRWFTIFPQHPHSCNSLLSCISAAIRCC